MQTPRPTNFYSLPGIYDILYTPGTHREVDLFARLASRHASTILEPKVWLEPACGSGRYLRVLAHRGLRVIGFDRSEEMLDYARQRLRSMGVERQVRLICADMEDFASRIGRRKADIAINPVNTFRHLLTTASASRHLEQIAECLRPGGLYLVGLSFARYGLEEPSEDVWEGRRGQCHVRQIVQYLPADRSRRRETVLSHVVVTRPASVEHLDSRYELLAYDERQWTRLIERSPLQRVASVDDGGRPTQGRDLNYQIEVLCKRTA